MMNRKTALLSFLALPAFLTLACNPTREGGEAIGSVPPAHEPTRSSDVWARRRGGVEYTEADLDHWLIRTNHPLPDLVTRWRYDEGVERRGIPIERFLVARGGALEP